MKLVINVCYGETEGDLELAGNNAMLRTKIMVDILIVPLPLQFPWDL